MNIDIDPTLHVSFIKYITQKCYYKNILRAIKMELTNILKNHVKLFCF